MSDTLPSWVSAGQRPATTAEAKEHKLTDQEWNTLNQGLNRTPSYLELGVVGALWSEHCSYKSSRPLLSQFLTEGPQVLQGPGENAGVVDIGDGWAVSFKMESHNHPSFLEPYQGAATGVGGIMRDVFTMGARPVASLNALRFGDPEDPSIRRKTRSLVHGVVAGIGDYGNCMGVPTVGGECWFHESYNGNNLVNAFTLGLLRSDAIFRGYATGVGNPVLYVGSKTGRDGIHGASMASDSFSGDGGPDQRPTVQVGDPFQEKKLLEACLELMQSDCIVGIQDMGAAGLTSSGFEMAERAGTGIRLDLSKVPTREPEMSPYELMLSESQERMLVVLNKGSEHIAEKIFERWDLDVAVIGEVIEANIVQLCWEQEVLTDLPVPLAVSGYSDPHRPAEEIEIAKASRPDPIFDWAKFLPQWMGHPNQASKEWIWSQYDSTVQAGTIQGPGGEAAVISPSEVFPKGIAMSADCPSRYVAVDPYEGGRHTVAGSFRNLACVGANSLGMTDCLNFGNPENPKVYWQFKEAIRGVADAGKDLEIPIVSGNVSLYNETDQTSVFPTPEIAVVGTVPDVRKGRLPLAAGDMIMLAGWHQPTWGGSSWALYNTGRIGGPLPDLDWNREKLIADGIRSIVRNRLCKDCKDLGSGGLLTALIQMLFRSGPLGFSTLDAGGLLADETLFWLGESGASYLLAVDAHKVDETSTALAAKGIPVAIVATVNDTMIDLGAGRSSVDLEPVYQAWRHSFAAWVNAND